MVPNLFSDAAEEQFDFLTPDEYHNASIDAFRRGGASGGFKVVAKGLEKFIADIDLLADAVRWAPLEPEDEDRPLKEINELIYAGDFYEMLKQYKQDWNWRAYDFSIDYLVDRKACTQKGDSKASTLKEALNLSDDFVKTFPDDERSYSAKTKVLLAMGKRDEAESVLDDVVMNKGANGMMSVAQCCLRYIEILLRKARYEDATKVAKVALVGTAIPQPSARIGYFLMVIALCRDALLIQRHLDDDGYILESNEVDSVLKIYRQALRLVGDDREYSHTIKSRIVVIQALAGTDAPEGEEALDSEEGPARDILQAIMRSRDVSPSE